MRSLLDEVGDLNRPLVEVQERLTVGGLPKGLGFGAWGLGLGLLIHGPR